MTTQNTSSRQAQFAEANARVHALADVLSPRNEQTNDQIDIDLSEFCHTHQESVDPNQSEFVALSEFLSVLGMPR